MTRAVTAVAVIALSLSLAAVACTARDGSDGDAGSRVFTTVDADHRVAPDAPVNPYSTPSNSALGYNGMRLAWPKNALVDDPEAFYPGVAKSWQVAPDQSTVTVEIQPDAEWSDGTPVTADDVRASAAVAFTQDAGAFTVKPYLPGRVVDVRVVDEEKVEFVRAPGDADHSFARNVLALDVVPAKTFGTQLPGDVWDTLRTATSAESSEGDRRAAWKGLAALRGKLSAYRPTKDLSCGPFVLRHVDARAAELVRNEHFWNADRIDVDRVVLRHYRSARQVWNALADEELDAAPYTATPRRVVRTILARKNNKKVTGFRPLALSLAFNQAVEPFDSPHVRRGLAYAIDTEVVTKAAAAESAFAAEETSGLVATVRRARIPDASVPAYYPDRAAMTKELTAAGLTMRDGRWHLPDGRPWSFEITVPAGFPDWLAAARSVSGQLRGAGVDVEVATVADYPTYLAGLEAGEHGAGLWQIAHGPSTVAAYQRLYGQDSWLNGPESVEGVNPGQLTDDLAAQPVDERPETLAELARFTGEQLPVIQLWDARTVVFVNTTRFKRLPQDDSDVLALSPGVWMQLDYVTPR